MVDKTCRAGVYFQQKVSESANTTGQTSARVTLDGDGGGATNRN